VKPTLEQFKIDLRAEGVPIMANGFVRERDAARILNVSRRSLRRWRTDGDERAPTSQDRMGNGVWYHIDDLYAAVWS
jgi:hypothetical protein